MLESAEEKGQIAAGIAETVQKETYDIIQHYVTEVQLFEILSEISSILFFLMGAMTIVEIVDIHGGFRVVTDRIKTTSKLKLFWILDINFIN